MLMSKSLARAILFSLVASTAACGESTVENDLPLEHVASSRHALSHDWSASFSSNDPSAWPEDIAIDGSGHVITVGQYGDSINFGGGALSESTWYGTFIAAFGSAGGHLWSKSFGSAWIMSVATDSSGNVNVAGVITDDVDFGGGTVLNGSAGGYGLFVAQFDASGNHVWSRRFGSTTQFVYIEPASIAVDSSDNILVAGIYQGDLAFGSDSSPSSSYGGFLAKLEEDGDPIFGRFFAAANSSTYVSVNAVATDPNDDSVAIAGDLTGTTDFGNGSLTSYNSGSSTDVFVAKFDDDGDPSWSKSYGTTTAHCADVVIDSVGNIDITGTFDDAFPFGSVTAYGWLGSLLVAQLESDGTEAWIQSELYLPSGSGIAVDPDDNVIIVGSYYGTPTFGGGYLPSAGGSDVFVAQYSAANLSYLDADNFGDSGSQLGLGIAVDSSGTAAITGAFDSSVNFGGSTLTADPNGQSHIFIAQLSLP
uniref:Secreted protein n=1 Tax=Sorangium cellulosum TaxID=56 RepID=A0A3Q8IBU4_SORCE|nr:secreted protein [Sorangium cellulosum]